MSMTTLTPAPKRLITPNIQLERNKDKSVKIIDGKSGSVRAYIPKDDWFEVAEFFNEISKPGALL
jgi:hypothetical protein